MFDVFYNGPKPNLFAFEQYATDLDEASAKCKTKYFWLINGNNDYTNFDFSFRPPPWQAEHTHVWKSQWQDNSGTMLVPKHVKDHQWNWHESPKTLRIRSVPIFYMDFGNKESAEQFNKLESKWNVVKRIRYIGSHLEVFKRIISQATSEYIWIISSICNYKNFDFTWHPKQWQTEMIHCFSWNSMEDYSRGDTFYIHVESFKKQMYELEILDWFNVIHYNKDQIVQYFQCPVVRYDGDNLINVIKNYSFDFPYVKFLKKNQQDYYFDHMCLWAEKDRQIVPYTSDNSSCLVPKDIKQYLSKQIYDYPYIRTQNVVVKNSPQLDIVYISNGEPDAEKWFERCASLSYGSVVYRVKNVNGRAEAYKAAANISTTEWFFAVFAKLEVESNFNWGWQPDYFQEPKHYIFHAKNPVNGLTYGHQAMIVYNKRLVLETEETGLDFTLSKSHAIVPILSGTAHFNQNPWTTWRTAFREVLKLRYFKETEPNIETNYRLKVWSTVAEGQFAEWSLTGARDALEYFDSVNGNIDQLKLSFEWNWLKSFAHTKGYNF